jgi:hypothetical protein
LTLVEVGYGSATGETARFVMSTAEIWALGASIGDLLAAGESIGSATARLEDADTGQNCTAGLSTQNTTWNASSVITQVVTGSGMVGGHSYWLYFLPGISGNANKKPAPRLRIDVVK